MPQMLEPRADCLVRPPARTRGPHERLEPTARCDDGGRIPRMEPAGQRSVGTGRWHPARNGAIDTAVWRDPGRGRAADRQSLGRNAPGLLPRHRSGHPAQGARQPERAGAYLAITCGAWNPDDGLLREPVVVVEILSPSNKPETWANVWSYVTIPSVLEILVLHTADIRADLLRREQDGSWPDNPLSPGRMGPPTRPTSAVGVSFRITDGQEVVARYEDRTAGTVRSFCSRCGTPLTYETKLSPHMVNIPRALFSSRTGRQPLYHSAFSELRAWAYTGWPARFA